MPEREETLPGERKNSRHIKRHDTKEDEQEFKG